MQYMGVNEIREKYLSFFESKEHLRLASASLIPHNDKSLLLINSGMAPLKPFFTGQQVPPRKRVTTCQKCIRTGDIENVGKTARHGTFFEMLGNFSFGDYFKHDAIHWAWEFFTEVIKLPEDRLYVSVYEEDDEAFDIWNKEIGLAKDRIFRMGKEDNFWEHGVGPCGPCSEIYYDKGEQYGCGKPGCTVGCDCDRYMEIWNLVFTQFCKEEDGSYSNLDHPNIDTGMGLERLATVLQGVNSIFDVDTVKAIRDKVCSLSGAVYGQDEKKDISIRVITDHIRSVAFMTADGVLASNEGRGYVLRRLLRRAARHGRLLGIEGNFMAQVCKVVIENSGDAYPELVEKQEHIYNILNVEETRFAKTIDTGLELLKERMNALKESGSKILPGEDSFKLYDTYGFPVDLMKEILNEQGMDIDEDAFRAEMEKQRQLARSARGVDTYMGADETVFHSLDAAMSTEFDGYTQTDLKGAKVLALVKEENGTETVVDTVNEGDSVSVILDKTSFYAEMGGQVGDIGIIENDTCCVEISSVTKFGGNKFIHKGVVANGSLSVSDTVNTLVNKSTRLSTCRNHTATHLLQAALRSVLGSHIEQAGSYVNKDRLRFDFTHFEAVSREDLQKVEKIVNDKILEAIPVEIAEMPLEQARKLGAMALFGEKYGEVVRVVKAGDFSVEFCGGTHVSNTSQIGAFKIVSEAGVAAGTRRIEALTGAGAIAYYEQQQQLIDSVSSIIKATPKNIISKVEALLAENKKLSSELEALKSKLSGSAADDMLSQAEQIGQIKVLTAFVKDIDMNSLRDMGDKLKDKLGECALVLASDFGQKVSFVVMCTDAAVKSGVKAGDIVKKAASVCGGGGGGRPTMAQAGAKDVSKIPEALELAKTEIKGILS